MNADSLVGGMLLASGVYALRCFIFGRTSFRRNGALSTYRWLAVVMILCGFGVAFGNLIMKAFSE
jgi:hypothetical protein